MLKIVDYYPNTKIPFPLKELEKFGLDDDKYYCVLYGDNTDLFVDKERRTIFIEEDTLSYEKTDVLDVLFNLIQAGLVEKMEKQNGNK